MNSKAALEYLSDDESRPWYADRKRLCGVLYISTLLTFAATARFCSCLNDFWFDEILSAEVFARQFDSVWTWLLTGETDFPFQHDNNHYFNTWIIYLIGPDKHWIFFRLPAVVAGIGTVALAWTITKRWGNVEANTALLLTSTSFLLIQYSSEARGYAYVQLFTLLSIELIYRGLEKNRWWIDVVFFFVAVFGFLSHLTYVYCFLSLLVWSTFSLIRQRRPWGQLAFRLCRSYLAPVLFLIWFYISLLRDIEVGGADTFVWFDVLVQTLSLAVGGPEAGLFAIIMSLAVVGLILVGLHSMYRAACDFWIFLFSGVILLPALAMIVRQPEFLYPRYFLICVLMAQLLMCFLAGQCYRHARIGKPTLVVLLLASVIGNTIHTARLVRVGRGQYQAAIAHMDQHTSAETITICSASKVRDRELLTVGFYVSRNLPAGRLVYSEQFPRQGSQWTLIHRFEREFLADEVLMDPHGNSYHLEKVFPYAGLSGWHWLLYRNDKEPEFTTIDSG